MGTLIEFIRSFCIWSAFNEACPTINMIISDLLISIFIIISFATLHYLTLYFFPHGIYLKIMEVSHEMSVVFSISGLSFINVCRLLRGKYYE